MTTVPLLVDAAWLATHRSDENIRIYDVSIAHGQTDSGKSFTRSGRESYEAEHVPGAAHADVLGDLAVADSPYAFTILDHDTFARRAGALGIGADSHVVLYDQGGNLWATRLWWNLRLEGFDRLSVLDGGLGAWKAAGFETEKDSSNSYPAATFVGERRPELLATKESVLAGIGNPNGVLVNSLEPETFRGDVDTYGYGRPGRIPDSVNVFFGDLVTEDGRVRGLDFVRPLFAEAGALDEDKSVVTYCGGGIAATFLAFQLARLGRDDVAVYDGSMNEWVSDESLPLEIG
ncbi:MULTISPECIES: sulfurtransferase [unclassified Rhodococcus (in: high G+C Gram-positive bacteria)]|uniref:sulfurtransferase n=1 Tax=unclassified Rhodococcus (in: high G+C Gram-positive bacteria) TaxID=192944 RepID=UPI0009269920|nr:sulfurtransferase [Rhodococcus sp. M8]OLL16241.1 sulfurtransferase [Rhodococcus sp. M8]QPG46305.1 sulfurtransferase [Rhodococcus sp. M8]